MMSTLIELPHQSWQWVTRGPRNSLTKSQETWLSRLEAGSSTSDLFLWKEQPDGSVSYSALGLAMELFAPSHPQMQPANYPYHSRGDRLSVGVMLRLGLRSRSGSFRRRADLLRGMASILDSQVAGAALPELAGYIRAHPWAVFRNFDTP